LLEAAAAVVCAQIHISAASSLKLFATLDGVFHAVRLQIIPNEYDTSKK
jgi:hypothetical protein